MLNVYAVDSGGFYAKLFTSGQDHLAGIIAIVGPITNLFFLFISMALLRVTSLFSIQWVLFWFAINNLGGVYSYVPIRAFSSSGDIAYFLRGFNFSPYMLLLLLPVQFFCLQRLCRYYLPLLLSGYSKSVYQATLLFTLLLIFAWYGLPALFYYGISDIRSISFPISMIVGAIMYWLWSQQEIQAEKLDKIK